MWKRAGPLGALVLAVAVALTAPATSASAATDASTARSAGADLTHAGEHLQLARRTPAGPSWRDVTGRRMRSGRTRPTRAALQYYNWSGLAGTGTAILGAAGAWTVPAVAASNTLKYSATWIGVDGLTNQDLIQAGTEQDAHPVDGVPTYYAWWEILPAYQTMIVQPDGVPALVKPGDNFGSYVMQTKPGVWTINIHDRTQGWFFEQSFDYAGLDQSAEWITEAPTVGGAQTAPAHFGTVGFSETRVFDNQGSGPAWYATRMNADNEIQMVDQSDTHVLVQPSAPTAPTAGGQTFSDTYVTPPSPPAQPLAAAGAQTVKVSWIAPANGGTPITGYTVREFRQGILQSVLSTTGTAMMFGNLVNGQNYTFSVAASSAGGYTSSYSVTSLAARPEG